MKREEKIRQAAESYAKGIAQDAVKEMYCRTDFIAGAQWADRSMIDKACEWLTRELCYTARNNNFLNNKVTTDEFVGLFKNAMKGGE